MQGMCWQKVCAYPSLYSLTLLGNKLRFYLSQPYIQPNDHLLESRGGTPERRYLTSFLANDEKNQVLYRTSGLSLFLKREGRCSLPSLNILCYLEC